METANNKEVLIQLVKTTSLALCNYIETSSNSQPKNNNKVYVIGKHWTDGCEAESEIIGVLDNISTAKEGISKLFDKVSAEYAKNYNNHIGVHRVINETDNTTEICNIEGYNIWCTELGIKDEILITLTECTINNNIKL